MHENRHELEAFKESIKPLQARLDETHLQAPDPSYAHGTEALASP